MAIAGAARCSSQRPVVPQAAPLSARLPNLKLKTTASKLPPRLHYPLIARLVVVAHPHRDATGGSLFTAAPVMMGTVRPFFTGNGAPFGEDADINVLDSLFYRVSMPSVSIRYMVSTQLAASVGQRRARGTGI